MAVTIREVAKLAGTSVAAVSAVISENRHHNIRVGAATRERILAAASELGYAPNPLAKSLVTGKTGMLGLVFPYSRAFTDGNPFCSQVMAGVFEEVVRDRYDIMLHTAAGDEANATADRALVDPRVDGLILVIPGPCSPAVQCFLRARFPFVAVVYEPDDERVFAVNADEYMGGRLATEHLLSLGHRRIAHLAGDSQIASAQPRKRGYLDALEHAGLPVDAALIAPSGFDYRDGYAAMCSLLKLPAARRPTGVFAANDLSAEGALRALREAGCRVPDDIAVVGYDDTWFATMTTPPLTSVHMPVYEMAMCATQMLIAQVEGREVPDRHPILPVTLSVRGSTVQQATHSVAE